MQSEGNVVVFRLPRVNLYLIGDVHLGTKNCDVEAVKTVVERVRQDPYGRVIMIGDHIEAINYPDKRFDPDNLDPNFYPYLGNLCNRQVEVIVEMFRPIAGKILGAHMGNHEDKVRAEYANNIHLQLVKGLETRDLGMSSTIELVFKIGKKTQKVTVYSSHGWGAGRKEGGKINKVIDMMYDVEADIYAMGHVHATDATRRAVLKVEDGKQVEHQKVFVVTGCFYRTRTEGTHSYAERKGYSTNSISYAVVEITPFGSRNGGALLEPRLPGF